MTQDRSSPTGAVTLLFTDIENSSVYWEDYKYSFEPLVEAHNELLRALAQKWNGVELRHAGDSLFLAFNLASDAVLFAIETQLAVAAREWKVQQPGKPAAGVDFKVRIGAHTCEAHNVYHPTGAFDYSGAEVNRAARVAAAPHGGQIILSSTARAIALPQLPEDVNLLDLGKCRLKGVGEEHLWQVGGRGLPEAFPPPSTLNRLDHNLPLPLTRFIGREAEIAAWSDVLMPTSLHPTRLLTLIGFGGIGKTRTSLQIAEACLESGTFPDGVWWVALAASEAEQAHTVDAMLRYIAQVLPLQLQQQVSVKEQVWAYLKSRQLLLVLDNTEQVPEARHLISELLEAAPRVSCLVNSRRALLLQSEILREVPPLPLAEATLLFVERAAARRSDVDPRADMTADIEALCRSLECVPLAIELAAARSLSMSPRDMLERLDRRFQLLASRSPDVPPRQRALRGTIDWSYELLKEEEKKFLLQLAVFVGGFTLEATEFVADDIEAGDLLHDLTSQSLLRAPMDAVTHKTRYAMFEAVREYLRDSEKCRDDRKNPAKRHAEYFSKFAESRVSLLKTREEALALSELETEFPNLRAAFEWAAKHDRKMCIQLAISVSQALSLRGLCEEARLWQQRGLQAAQTLESAALPPRLLQQTACLCDDLGLCAEAKSRAGEALEAFRAAGDAAGTADALNLLGVLATNEGDIDRARPLLEQALALSVPQSYALRAKTLHNLARLASLTGGNDAAWRLYEESLVLRRRAGDERGEALTLSNLGTLAQRQQDYVQARRYYEQSLEPRRKLRDTYGIAVTLHNLGDLDALEGRLERAVALLTHAEHMFLEIKSPYAAEPAERLRELSLGLDEHQFRALRTAAEASSWEAWLLK